MIDYSLPLDQLPDPLPIVPLTKPFDVTITPPGSKSITNRAYILAALADGESRIVRPLRADDTDLLLDALCTLGVQVKWVDGENGEPLQDVLITGVNGRFPNGGEVNLGDGGTPTRFMIAAACLAAEPVVVDGSKRMRERPIAEGVDMLRQLGATIEYVEEEGRLPVRVVPSDDFKGGTIEVGKTQSSQFISAVMLIGAWLEEGVEFEFIASPTSFSYVQLTVDTLSRWPIDSGCNHANLREVRIKASHQSVHASNFEVESDASSGAFFIAAAALTSSAVVVPNIRFDSCQPDVYVAKRLQPEVWEWRSGKQWGSPMRFPVSENSRLGALDEDASLYPDGALALTVALALADSRSEITGLHTLRVKECDRLEALATELRKVGCTVETTEDSITIHPIPEERLNACSADDPIVIETYNDHRMAMAFAILGLRVPGLAIKNPAVVSKSYPTFWQDFAKLYEQQEVR